MSQIPGYTRPGPPFFGLLPQQQQQQQQQQQAQPQLPQPLGARASGLSTAQRPQGQSAFGPLATPPTSHSTSSFPSHQEASLDPAEFPALGAASSHSNTGGSGPGSHPPTSYSQASSQANHQSSTSSSQQQQQQPHLSQEDFPALDSLSQQQQQHHQNMLSRQQQLNAAAAYANKLGDTTQQHSNTSSTTSSSTTTASQWPPPSGTTQQQLASLGSGGASGNGNNSNNNGDSSLSQIPSQSTTTSSSTTTGTSTNGSYGAFANGPSSTIAQHARNPSPNPSAQRTVGQPLPNSNNNSNSNNNGQYLGSSSNATVTTGTTTNSSSNNDSSPSPNTNANININSSVGGGVGTNNTSNENGNTAGGASAVAAAATAATTILPPRRPLTPAQQVIYSPADRFSLLGLLSIIKSSDPDTAMLSLGKDLSKLGLDVTQSDNLYSNFVTPWQDSTDRVEPEFHLPPCYNVQPPPAQTKIGCFAEETLFLIFYSQPRDVMQEAAAQELYKKNWRYHKELKLWLTKLQGVEPTQKTATYERGSYVFFDPINWEKVKKEFVLVYDMLESRSTPAPTPISVTNNTALPNA